MTTYPHRYGDTDRARQHYATACVASAAVLRSEGLPDQAADLEDAARHVTTHPERPDQPDNQHHDNQHHDTQQHDADQDTRPHQDDDVQVPRWWR